MLTNPIRFNSLYDFLNGVLNLVIVIGFPIVVLFIVWIGFRFVQTSASGDSKGLDEAKKNIWYAIIGALLLLGAKALSLAIQATVAGLQSGL